MVLINLRYEEFKEKDKSDLSFDKDGKFVKNKTKQRQYLPVEKLKNMSSIRLRKIESKIADYFVLNNYDDNNIKNSKLVFTHYNEELNQYFNIILEYVKEKNNFLETILKKENKRYWQIKINQVTETNILICECMRTIKNSQEELEIKNILENDKKLNFKIIELFEFYKYNGYKIDRKMTLF